MVFSLVMHFQKCHFRIYFRKYFADYNIRANPFPLMGNLKQENSVNTQQYTSMGNFEVIIGGHSCKNNSL